MDNNICDLCVQVLVMLSQITVRIQESLARYTSNIILRETIASHDENGELTDETIGSHDWLGEMALLSLRTVFSYCDSSKVFHN